MDYNLNLMKLLIVGALAMIGSALQFNHEGDCTDKGSTNGCRSRQYCSKWGWCEYKENNGQLCFGDYECKSGKCVKRSYDDYRFCEA